MGKGFVHNTFKLESLAVVGITGRVGMFVVFRLLVRVATAGGARCVCGASGVRRVPGGGDGL